MTTGLDSGSQLHAIDFSTPLTGRLRWRSQPCGSAIFSIFHASQLTEKGRKMIIMIKNILVEHIMCSKKKGEIFRENAYKPNNCQNECR